MIGHVRRILTGQFEAALCMMNDCLTKCPPEHWDGIVGKYPFWHVAYHTLCFTDLYLSRDKESFEFRDVHPCGWKDHTGQFSAYLRKVDETFQDPKAIRWVSTGWK
jgi:hypothetical protein